MIDQELTFFLSEIEGGMPIRPRTGTGSTEKSRYGDGNDSTDMLDEGLTIAEGEDL